MNMSNPNLHRHTRLKRKKKSTCKFCTQHGETINGKKTISGCNKCDKHICSFECHKRIHAVIGVVVMEELSCNMINSFLLFNY